MLNCYYFFFRRNRLWSAYLFREKNLLALLFKAEPRAKFSKKLKTHKLAELEVNIKIFIKWLFPNDDFISEWLTC